MSDETKPGFHILVSKQTAMTGEVIQIQTNLPVGSSGHDLFDAVKKITGAIDKRLEEVNKSVLAKTGKSLEELGLDIPGFRDEHLGDSA